MTRNVEMLLAVARAFGELRDEVVFVGGAIVDLLVTDPAAPRPRFTDDVDVVVEVTTQVEWYALGDRRDFVASHDVEDVIAVVDGRLSLGLEVEQSPIAVRRFLAEGLGEWLGYPRFLDAVPGHLPGDAASQARAELVVARMKAMVRG